MCSISEVFYKKFQCKLLNNKTHLENSSSEQRLMQTNSASHRVSVRELDVCKAAKKK